MEWLANSSEKPGQDPDDYFMGNALTRSELEKVQGLFPTRD